VIHDPFDISLREATSSIEVDTRSGIVLYETEINVIA
jgi:hypothetical protein